MSRHHLAAAFPSVCRLLAALERFVGRLPLSCWVTLALLAGLVCVAQIDSYRRIQLAEALERVGVGRSVCSEFTPVEVSLYWALDVAGVPHERLPGKLADVWIGPGSKANGAFVHRFERLPRLQCVHVHADNATFTVTDDTLDFLDGFPKIRGFGITNDVTFAKLDRVHPSIDRVEWVYMTRVPLSPSHVSELPTFSNVWRIDLDYVSLSNDSLELLLLKFPRLQVLWVTQSTLEGPLARFVPSNISVYERRNTYPSTPSTSECVDPCEVSDDGS